LGIGFGIGLMSAMSRLSRSEEAYMNRDIVLKGGQVEFRTGGVQVCALKNANIRFPAGQLTALVGESGSGKSVLGMSILRLLPPTAQVSGSCYYCGQDLYRCSDEEMRSIRCRIIGLIPQNPLQALNPVLRLGRQLVEPLTTHLGMSRDQAVQQTRQSLREFGFSDPDALMRSYSFQLSGGMNQRVVSGMGLACKPDWVIADEPTKGLDAILRRQVFEVLSRARDSGAGSMLIITHDLLLARKLCQRTVVLYQGQILEQGPTAKVFAHPLHPYTEGLLRSLPEAGMVPIPRTSAEKSSGKSECRFYPRCAKACGACRNGVLRDFTVGEGRIVRCALYA